MNDVEQIIGEVRRKSPRKSNRQVSSEMKFAEDLENHNYSEADIDDLKKIIQMFKERKDTYLKSNHDAHELDRSLKGYSSVKLYPGEYEDRDIVILYKMHRDDHVVLHGIGNHEYVYGKFMKKSTKEK